MPEDSSSSSSPGAARRPARPEGKLSPIFGALAVALAAARFYKFRPFLDEPHAFRQAWTSYTAQEFYRFSMNIFRPSIIAMGNYRHVLIEFPVPEWITAVVYQATGPTLYVDRLLSIALFLGSAYFLFRAIELVQDRLFAWVVVLIYLSAPLGIYFSRAVHIDSAALCAGHAFLYYFLRYGEAGRRRDLAWAFVASALGFLIKAPYVFYLILPVLYFQYTRGQLRRAVISASVFAAALVAGLAWYSYAQSVNRGAPDLSFIRGYETTADRVDFYVGGAGQRLSGEAWGTIGIRVRQEIAADIAWPLALAGLFWRRRLRMAWGFAAVWTLGTFAFLLAFFPVNVIHNYYQLTFIAPFALWTAIPLYRGLVVDGPSARFWKPLALVVLVVYVVAGFQMARRKYYQVDTDGITVGDFVQARTTARDLVIMAANNADFLDPRYLYYAQRRGWSIRAEWLEPRAIEGLRTMGATFVVTSDQWPTPEPTARYLESLPLVDTLGLGGHHVFLRRAN